MYTRGLSVLVLNPIYWVYTVKYPDLRSVRCTVPPLTECTMYCTHIDFGYNVLYPHDECTVYTVLYTHIYTHSYLYTLFAKRTYTKLRSVQPLTECTPNDWFHCTVYPWLFITVECSYWTLGSGMEDEVEDQV